MCKACAANAPPPNPKKRCRLWEIDPARLCSIIGTSLTLGELRVLARKLGYRADKGKNTDFFIHGFFVSEASKKSRATKLLNKLLDRKHAATIRRYQRITTSEDLAAAWEEDNQAGKFPGLYWAVLSHPNLNEALGLRVYGDIHMLSHLVSASNIRLAFNNGPMTPQVFTTACSYMSTGPRF